MCETTGGTAHMEHRFWLTQKMENFAFSSVLLNILLLILKAASLT